MTAVKTRAIEHMNAQEAIELLQRCDKATAPCVFRLFAPAVQAELRRTVHRAHGERQ